MHADAHAVALDHGADPLVQQAPSGHDATQQDVVVRVEKDGKQVVILRRYDGARGAVVECDVYPIDTMRIEPLRLGPYLFPRRSRHPGSSTRYCSPSSTSAARSADGLTKPRARAAVSDLRARKAAVAAQRTDDPASRPTNAPVAGSSSRPARTRRSQTQSCSRQRRDLRSAGRGVRHCARGVGSRRQPAFVPRIWRYSATSPDGLCSAARSARSASQRPSDSVRRRAAAAGPSFVE